MRSNAIPVTYLRITPPPPSLSLCGHRKSLATIALKCELGDADSLFFLADLNPRLLMIPAGPLSESFEFLASMGFGTVQFRNVALACSGFLELSVEDQVKPVFMAMASQTDAGMDAVAKAFPEVTPEVLELVGNVLEVTDSQDDELALALGLDEEED